MIVIPSCNTIKLNQKMGKHPTQCNIVIVKLFSWDFLFTSLATLHNINFHDYVSIAFHYIVYMQKIMI
jgi:hypothetical protein